MEFVRKLESICSNTKCANQPTARSDKQAKAIKTKSRKVRRTPKSKKPEAVDKPVEGNFEASLLSNGNLATVGKLKFFRKNKLTNNNAFRTVYRNFKEVEYIHSLR